MSETSRVSACDDAPEAASVDPASLAGPLEALLIMASEPMSAVTLAEALQVPQGAVEECLAQLADFYDDSGRGFMLRHAGGGWRFATRPEHAEVIEQWIVGGQQSKLSQAALETLAVIAYTQPISRSRVSAVRGVNVDGVVRTLLARDLICELGADEVSGAALFGTTELFLEKMGLNALDELPPIAPHLPDAGELADELAQLAGPAAGGTAVEQRPEQSGPEQSSPELTAADQMAPAAEEQA